MSNAIDILNALPTGDLRARFTACCGSTRWVDRMIARRPFANEAQLASSADDVWQSLAPDDWREAFSHHPRIGERSAPAAASAQSSAWSSNEQSRVVNSSAHVQNALARVNADYEHRFGFTYIVRAAGRSAEEMLALARERLANEPETELRVAAEQQREIMQLRLSKTLDDLRRSAS